MFTSNAQYEQLRKARGSKNKGFLKDIYHIEDEVDLFDFAYGDDFRDLAS